jgi:hypothetical protein
MATNPERFVERRNYASPGVVPLRERRQFPSGGVELSPEAQQLGRAIDQYKYYHRRRHINCEEILAVIKALGYRRTGESAGEVSSS